MTSFFQLPPVTPITGDHADHVLTWQERVWNAYSIAGTDTDGNLRVDWGGGEETDMETSHVWCHTCNTTVSFEDLNLADDGEVTGLD